MTNGLVYCARFFRLPRLSNSLIVGWEDRERGGRYYYRSRWQEGRVLKEYVGTGRVGELAAEADRVERERREVERRKEKQDRQGLATLAAPVLELSEAAEVLVRAHLIAAGCHRHKGEWRRVRERSA